MSVVTRFAPSPTDYLHGGGLRTALYAYLFAKQQDGKFILRIEDTDQKRYVEGAVENLLSTLKFFGLNWEEGPYFQSQRTEIYRKYAAELLEKGKAYRCFCSEEDLEKMREEQMRLKIAPKYDRRCHSLAPEVVEKNCTEGKPFVIRQLIPYEDLNFDDVIRGAMHFHGRDVDDQVLIKSDGFPTYHLANVVDDHEMGVTNVIRGEEWLPSTPKHIWLYRDFGWTPPTFAHLPLLLNPDRSKLSKRQGDVAAEDYIKKGYLKEAILNFIVFLGWNPGTEQEFFSMNELINTFSLDRVQKAGAVFNIEKLDWLNGHYLRAKSPSEIAELINDALHAEPWFDPKMIDHRFMHYMESVQTRMKTLVDGPAMLKPFLLEKFEYDAPLFTNVKMNVDLDLAKNALLQSEIALKSHMDWDSEDALKETFTRVIQEMNLKNGQVLWPVRVALTNEAFSPGVFELCRVLGKEQSLNRIKNAIDFLSK